MNYNPYFEPEPRPERVRIRFSRTEIQHLAMGVAFLTVAFTFVINDRSADFSPAGALARIQAPWTLYLQSFFGVSTGFVLHELGHKVIAQRYGHWAEFRGDFRALAISLAFAAGLGFLFAAPGAVMIWGRVDDRQNGLISIMGPAINFLIALIAIPFTFAVDRSAFFPATMIVVAFVNAVLCLFNLLPIMNLDGRKVLHWNKPIYFAALLTAIALVVFIYMQGILI